jgi:DNA-binding XRE family transcriptional regulator
MTVTEFVENIFFGIGYELRATIVGFNLPFDISRIAIRHGNARGRIMRGGFTYQLSPHRWRPNVQIKYLSAHVALIRFTTRPGHVGGRGMRKRKIKPPPRPGYFVDVHILAAGLTSIRGSLASLADALNTKSRKLFTDEHGDAVTDNYLVYAKQDVQVTRECYCALLEKFAEHNFTATLPHKIFSEASTGKAYFKEMNIRPWREVQPDFPNDLSGIIMSTYFGGRSEVHHRRMISQVSYCDFLSMYPTVCTLMGLWRFVIANGVTGRDNTETVVEFLQNVSLGQLQRQDTWALLTTLVQVIPSDDVFPIRANYAGDEQDTIGLNHLHSSEPFWFTLADCVASKLRTGKLPKIRKAITFEPNGIQGELKPITIAGNPDYQIDPYIDDFYKRLIDLRTAVKKRLKVPDKLDRPSLESTQLTLKILANSTCYGNFVELNVTDLPRAEKRRGYGYRGMPFVVATDKSEEPGRYFHPLIATLITGAARLMLAITETLVLESGLDWAFCDTDSMAIAKPEGMDDAAFFAKVQTIRNWFSALNPYSEKGSLLKSEDANFKIRDVAISEEIEPLYCLAISAKRYALFNISEDGRVTIRKASAHGLGHLLPPYGDSDAPLSIPTPQIELGQIGVERWQYDLWHQIIRATLDGHPDQIDLDYHPNLDKPAASRYAATTPNLLSWFDIHNENRPYSDQVRPSNFLLSFQIDPTSIHKFPKFEAAICEKIASKPKAFRWLKPIAPFSKEPVQAAEKCFDRDTGVPVPSGALKTYIDALAQYHLRSEQKFLNGHYTDQGITHRRRVRPLAVSQIGKEANRWEEKHLRSTNSGSQINYGISLGSDEQLIQAIREATDICGQRNLAKRIGISRQTLSKIGQNELSQFPPELIRTICKVILELNKDRAEKGLRKASLLAQAKTEIARIGLSEFAMHLEIDPSNLIKILNNKRQASDRVLDRIYRYFNS